MKTIRITIILLLCNFRYETKLSENCKLDSQKWFGYKVCILFLKNIVHEFRFFIINHSLLSCLDTLLFPQQASIKAWAPGVVFGCSGILCSLMVPLLPETRNKPLPETLQDVDDRWRASKIKFTSKGDGIVNVAYKHDVEHEGSSVKNGTASKSGTEE